MSVRTRLPGNSRAFVGAQVVTRDEMGRMVGGCGREGKNGSKTFQSLSHRLHRDKYNVLKRGTDPTPFVKHMFTM